MVSEFAGAIFYYKVIFALLDEAISPPGGDALSEYSNHDISV